jgi:hypothetical protein
MLWGAAIAFVVLAGLGIYLLFLSPSNNSMTIAGNATPSLTITPEGQDLGTIDASQGILTTTFTVQNTGDGDLVINEMETSCGCTSATLIANGKEGPRYGMRGHGAWPTGWSARLKPSETAQLRVTYDPNAHGFFEGPVERLIIIHSNDPQQPQKQIRFTGNQVGGRGK